MKIGIVGLGYVGLERLVRESPLVVDFRGVTRGIKAANLVRL